MTSSTPASARPETGAAMKPLLSVEDLCISAGPRLPLIENLSFVVHRGETLAIVGESGCGKSLTSLAVMGLLPTTLRQHQTGAIRFGDADIARLSESRLSDLRGKDISMIFQDPLGALNPVMTIGTQIAETLR